MSSPGLNIACASKPAADGTPRPYVHVRGGLEALINRAVFYELADAALAEGGEPPGLWSGSAFFPFTAA